MCIESCRHENSKVEANKLLLTYIRNNNFKVVFLTNDLNRKMQNISREIAKSHKQDNVSYVMRN